MSRPEPLKTKTTVPAADVASDEIEMLAGHLARMKTQVEIAFCGDAHLAARAFVRMREIKDQLEENLKPFNKFYDECKTIKLPELFERAGTTTVNLDEGYRVTVSQSIRASVREGLKEAALAWLRANKLGDLVQETINASTLSAAAKTLVEDENRELDPDIFNVAVIPNTSVTRTKKSVA